MLHQILVLRLFVPSVGSSVGQLSGSGRDSCGDDFESELYLDGLIVEEGSERSWR